MTTLSGVRGGCKARVMALLAGFGSLAWGPMLTGQEPKAGSEVIGRTIAGFSLKATGGQEHSLDGLAKSKLLVVAFLGHECPLVRAYVPRLNQLQEQYAGQGVEWLAINSNQQDSLAELQNFVRELKPGFPLLKDPGNVVADQLGASRTPQVFVLDQQRTVRYAGRIDDQFTYGRQRPNPESNDLAQALDELLAGKPVSVPETGVAGCIIGRILSANTDESKGTGDVTWSNQISRIVYKSCVACHRAGEIGPFELVNFSEAAGWAGMIREVVNQRRMPPWHASPDHGRFNNDVRLTEDEIALINRWVEAGAPEGDPATMPELPPLATGWQMGEPDLVVSMAKKPFPVPATGTLEYQYFQVDPGFTEDKWVSAAECRADQRGVIHHIIVGVAGEGDFGEGVHGQVQSDWIAASAPGSPPMVLPPGYAKLIPAGAKLIFQMHYTPNGTPTEDFSSIGLRFVDAAAVTHRVLTVKAHNERFEIPPGADSHPVSARMTFGESAELLTLFPHMHLRGKSFRFTARLPDGTDEILLDVPHYDFNWQNSYELAERRLMPKGTRVRCEATFDNSTANLANPDPEKTVRWGDQTWEEMMIGYMNVAVPVGE